jgi:hypothetical protein
MQPIKKSLPTTGYDSIKASCLKHALPSEIWTIRYDKENLDDWKAGYPANTFDRPGPYPEWKEPPVNIGAINFPELIKGLEWELESCRMAGFLQHLHVNEEMALACVRLTRWLLENGKL